eukprot:3936158-Rhodomonas_salina.1
MSSDASLPEGENEADKHATKTTTADEKPADSLTITAMLLMIVTLWTNAVCFTCHFWAQTILKSLYITTRALSMLSPYTKATEPALCQTTLIDGTILYSMRTPIAPKSMLNTITTEALDRMFGSAAGSARKTPLAAGAPK